MSDHEEASSGDVYQPPVPELDDHRLQLPSTQREDHPRRGTFDSLYGPRYQETHAGVGEHIDHGIRVRDFEEAVVDDDVELSPPIRRSRRPTVDTITEQRDVSPPNSVKAFAEARRRERDMSFSGSRGEKNDEDGINRATSIASRRSHRSLRSRPRTIDDDAASLETNQSAAAEDVCFPHPDHRKDQLYIDFNYLENFINEERAAKSASRRPSSVRTFPDLRTQNSADDTAPVQAATVDGDIIEIPSDRSFSNEKPELDDANEPKKAGGTPLDPNRFSFFSSAWESTIHAAELGDLVMPGEEFSSLFALPPDEEDGVWWLNMNNATKEEVQAICKAFGIHPLTTEDITTGETREKIELFPAYYFACFRSFQTLDDSDGPEYDPHNIYVVVFREGTLSFSFAQNTHATQVRKRIALLKDYLALSSDWICYALIDDIVDSFAPVIHKIEQEADAIEDEVFVARQDDANQFLRKIGRVRKNVLALMRLLGGKADVLKGFTKRCNENYKVTPRMDIGMYLGDIQDHVVTMVTNLGHFEKILSRAHSNYLAQLSINNIAQGTDTNRVLSKITVLASILVPLNLVSGLFGMNVEIPFRDVENLGPFFGIVAFMMLVCFLCLSWARRQKFI